MIGFILGVYIGVALFILGFGVAEESSFVSPNYTLVVAIAVFWPLIAVTLIVSYIINVDLFEKFGLLQ